MTERDDTERAYYDAFRARLIGVRTELDWSQADAARALSIPLANYKKYETRSKFPLHLLDRLVLVTHRDLDFWVTGRNVKAFPKRLAS